MTCRVSVIVPAYNSASTLPRAVRSVLLQSIADLEVIVVNDASRDHTAAVVDDLARMDPRVRLLSQPQNLGKPAAMNAGSALAKGEWLAVLDADDWYAPTRLSTLLAVCEREEADLVADNQYLYDDGAERVVRTAFPRGEGYRKLDTRLFVVGSNPYANFDFGMLKPMVRADFIRRTGLRYREAARLSEDFLYLVEFLAAGGRAFVISDPCYYWRQAFGSISRRWTETGNGRWRYNFLSAAAANADLLRDMRVQDQPELSRLLRSRVHAFVRLHLLQEVSRMRAGGAAPIEIVREVLVHPSIWRLVMQRGLRRLNWWKRETGLQSA